MKTKQLTKKLKLNKKTVAHLDNGEMKVIFTGIKTEECPSWIKTQCDCTTVVVPSCGPFCTALEC